MDTMKKEKRQSKNGRKYLQIIYLLRDFYLEYIKNSYNSIIKRQPNFKTCKRFEWTFLERIYTNWQ